MNGDALIRDYLDRLAVSSGPLTPGRRAELEVEVAEHIQAALAERGAVDEATVRNVLDRLGPPEDIVAAELASGAPIQAPESVVAGSAPRRAWGPVEIVAVLLITPGFVFLPVVGPLAGLALVWASSRWSTRAKTITTLIVVVLVVAPVLLLFGAGAVVYAPSNPVEVLP